MSLVQVIKGKDREEARAFRSELLARKMPQSAQVGAAALLCVNSVFVVVDWFIFPSLFAAFLPVRFGLNAVLVFIYVFMAKRAPRASAVVTYLAGATMLFTVNFGTGGDQSQYYVGLVLLLMGGPVLVPFSALENAALSAVVVALFAAMPATNGTESVTSGLPLAFLCSASLVGTISASHLHRLRYRDYLQRVEIERSRDQLAELNKLKSDFITSVHHELRTPLAIIVASVELLSQDEALSREALQAQVDRIRLHALRLLRMISNLLDVARIQEGRLRVRRIAIDLRGAVVRVVTGAKPLADRRGVRLDISAVSDRIAVLADPDAIEQLLINLLGNAIKFTPSGGAIRISAWQSRGSVIVEVSDTGCGFSSAAGARLFERFWQEDSSSRRVHEGSGLGLALCKEIIQAHGGSIEGRSDGAGKGATFTIVLPVIVQVGEVTTATLTSAERELEGALEAQLSGEHDSGATIASRSASRPSVPGEAVVGRCGATETGSREIVLVADDSRDLRELVAHVLAGSFETIEAANGLEALEQIRLRRPALVVLDLMMPGTSGIDVCRAVRNDRTARATPILVLTARDERDARIACLEMGADDYMAKPFHPRELLARVRSLTRMHSLQRELSTSMIDLAGAVERERSARSEVELYARAVSHDLRSPLAAASEALRLATDDPRMSPRWLRLASESLERANRMLLGLRDLMRTTGRREPFGEVDVAALLQDLVCEVEASGRAVQGEIVIRGEFGRVFAQSQKLAHVFRNLLTNALQHGRSHDNAAVELWQREDDEKFFFSIADRGSGIPEQFLSTIFDPFVRGEGVDDGGLGLGLTLARQIVAGHGGRIWAEARSGGGTTFCFFLPKQPVS